MILRNISALSLKLLGWRLESKLPEEKKFVLIGAPHTSNWDFPLALLALSALGLRFSWVAKHTIFKGISGYFLKSIGGIPVNRNASKGFIDLMADSFTQKDKLILTIAPEGTRSKKNHWKTGFYYIALKADVTICMSAIDYPSKTISVNGVLTPTGDIASDFQIISEFYKGKTGKHPQRQSSVTLRDKE